MTYHGLTLNFDSEVDLFDCLSSIMSQVDELDVPQGLEAVENVETLDTTNSEEVRAYVDSVRDITTAGGESLWALVNRLPQINGIGGATHMKTKIIKYLNLKKLLPPQYDRKFRHYLLFSLRCLMLLSITGQPYSKFSKASDRKALEEAFITACSVQQHLTAFQSALCDPFVKDVVLNQGPSSSVVNRVAMMAHLLVHEKALPLWEQLHQTPAQADRPAMLDQTDGVAGNRQDIAERLLSLVEVIKEDLDLSRLQPDHCGAEAADAMKDIHAAQAVFKNALEILELYTTYCNQHDALLTRLDASGNFEIALERRMKCFASYIGPPGKSKNMGLYYCFLLWEGQPTRLTSHRLGAGTGRSSSSSSSLLPDSQGSGSQESNSTLPTLSKGDKRKVH